MSDAHFHWGEGLKYVAEGLKGVFVLNGAAAISVLTFVGNLSDNGHLAVTELLVFAMVSFGIGAVLGPVSFAFAYLTQLSYGNDDAKSAWSFHRLTYWSFGASLLAFFLGLCLAAFGLLRIAPSPA